MTAENGNGELRQLLEIKRGYRGELAEREAELKAEYERQVAEAKKELKGKYLEKIVDTVFAEPTQAAVEVKDATVNAVPHAEIKTEVTPKPAPAPPVTVCPECESPVDPSDKFCPQCAAPLREEEKVDEEVAVAGRHVRTRHRS